MAVQGALSICKGGLPLLTLSKSFSSIQHYRSFLWFQYLIARLNSFWLAWGRAFLSSTQINVTSLGNSILLNCKHLLKCGCSWFQVKIFHTWLFICYVVWWWLWIICRLINLSKDRQASSILTLETQPSEKPCFVSFPYMSFLFILFLSAEGSHYIRWEDWESSQEKENRGEKAEQVLLRVKPGALPSTRPHHFSLSLNWSAAVHTGFSVCLFLIITESPQSALPRLERMVMLFRGSGFPEVCSCLALL